MLSTCVVVFNDKPLISNVHVLDPDCLLYTEKLVSLFELSVQVKFTTPEKVGELVAVRAVGAVGVVDPIGQPAAAYTWPFVHTQIPLGPVGVAPVAQVQGTACVDGCAIAHIPPVEEVLDVEEVQAACVVAQVLSEHLIGVA